MTQVKKNNTPRLNYKNIIPTFMKLFMINIFYNLIIFIFFIISINVAADVISDAELESLEKQLEQQEQEARKQAEEMRKIEQEKQRQNEIKQNKKEEDRKNQELDVQKKLELEKIRILEEGRKRLEEEQKRNVEKEREAKLNSLMMEATNAENAKDYDLAIIKYNNVLKEFPNNTEAVSKIEYIQSLLKICKSLIGIWHWNTGAETRFYDDGKVSSSTSIIFIKSDGTWNCSGPVNRTFTFNTWGKERKITMSTDGNKIESIDAVLGTKITAKKVSNNPFEKVTPRKTDSEIPGL